MEVVEMLAMHSVLVKIFLGFLVAGLFIPLIAKSPLGFKKGAFIYTMIFQGIITMVAFAGLVAVFTGDLGWSVTTIIMVAVWGIMMIIEIKKHKAIKMANLNNSDTLKVLKSGFIKISVVQVLLVTIMVVLMVLKAKGVISI